MWLSKLTKEDEQQQALQDIAPGGGTAHWGWACEMESLGEEGLGVQSFVS